MPWPFDSSMLKRVRSLTELARVLAEKLPSLYQTARYYEVSPDLPYGTTVRPSGYLGRVQKIRVTDGAAFTVANPEKSREGAIITLDFHNDTTGPMGTVTFGSEYRLASAFQAPQAGSHAVYTFGWYPL